MSRADQTGHWGDQPMCLHRKHDDHLVLHLKLMKIPLQKKRKRFGDIASMILDQLGVVKRAPSQDHFCIFADIKCKVCGKQTVFTMEFETFGSLMRRGYYKEGGILCDQVICKQSQLVQWQEVVDLYNQMAESIGENSMFPDNYKDFVKRLWPKVKNYAKSCRKCQKSQN